LETVKVGGAENFTLVQQLYNADDYKTQQTEMIKQVLESSAPEAAATDAAATEANEIDEDTLEGIRKNGYINGDEDARITILEYSEFLCPFCKRQSDNKVVEQVMEKYPDDVNRMFKNYIVHGDAAKIVAEAVECAADQGDEETYAKAILAAFAIEDKSQAGLLSIAKALKLDEDNFEDCLEDHKFGASVDSQTMEGRTLFGVNGTPGNVIIDNEKGTRTLIAGAYPVEEFLKVVEGILAD
jgi:protein-disulfide isomerase